jgi:TRAP-type C4-dicarboxylate transport system substrate-binding protein
MYLMGHGPGIVSAKKPVEKLEDLKGLKIRSTGSSAKIVAALGATPVAMPQNEAYDALQKGVVEGLVSPIETLKGWKYAEVVKYTTRNVGSSYSVGFFVAMNRAKWDALPKEAQAAIEAVNVEWIDRAGKAWDDFDKAGTEFALSKGVKIIELSQAEDARWAELVKPVLDDYVTAAKAKGVPGDEALKFAREWLKANP